MIVVSVSYPAAGSTRFDHEYYVRTHMALVHSRWDSMGLEDARVLRGTGTPDGKPAPVLATALLSFTSAEAFQAAARQHGREIFADIANFTDAKAVMQINEPAE